MLAGGDLAAGQISQTFDISAPSISHHLNVLKNADLIQGCRDGQQIVYSLNTTVVQDALTLFMDVFSKNNPVENEK